MKHLRHRASTRAFVFPLQAISLEKFDIGGVLYHANYFHLLEQAREALLAHAGMPYPKLVTKQQHLAIVHSEQEFLLPIHYGEPIDIAVWCTELKNSTARLSYLLIRDKDAQAVHLASTKLVFVEQDQEKGFRPQKMPSILREAFDAIYDPS